MLERHDAHRRGTSDPPTTGHETERWRTFLAFWIAAAIMFILLGVGVFVAAHHGHRIGFALLLLGLASLLIARIVRKAAPRETLGDNYTQSFKDDERGRER